jgi:ubiquinone/menaquinone biosynthesis C-methylase UbiE
MKKQENNYGDRGLWTYHQTDNAQNLLMGHPRQDILYKKANKLIEGGKILEIGFGDGYLLSRLASKYKGYGADISEKNIEQMKNRIPQVKFNLVDVDGKLPYEDNFFSGFVASEVLEHMDDKELKVCVAEAQRVLIPGGIAIITFPAEEDFKINECFCPSCENKFHKWGHKQYWDKKRVENIFKGFEIVEAKTFFTRYRGENVLESLFGWVMWIARTFLKKVTKIDGATYLIVLKNK